MTVDFAWRECPSYGVASIVRVGPWREDNLRSEFQELVRWARAQGVRTGAWLFLERGHHRWEACLEVRGRCRAEGRLELKTLPAARAATVRFDPERVASRVVYHGLREWTREQRRAGAMLGVAGVREVYPGDPWNDPRAWSSCEVQFLVRRRAR